MESLGPWLVVPGHGNVAPASLAIPRARAYISGLLDQVEQVPAISQAEDWATKLPVPEGCGEHWFRENVRFLLKRRI